MLNKQFTRKKTSVDEGRDGPNPFRKLKYFDQEYINNLRHHFDSVAGEVTSKALPGGRGWAITTDSLFCELNYTGCDVSSIEEDPVEM